MPCSDEDAGLMKSLLRKPRFELFWPSLWLAVFGTLIVVSGVIAIHPFLLCLGTCFWVIAILIWQEVRGAIWVGLGVCLLLALAHLLRVLLMQHWISLVYGISFASIGWGCWDGLQKMKRGADQGNSGIDEQSESSDSANDEPLASLVLFQREPKYLEANILARILQTAWGQPYRSGDEPDAADDDSEFNVVGENPIYMITGDQGVFVVHNHDEPYFEELDEVVDSIGELRLRKAVSDHVAWLSVDWLMGTNPEAELSTIYERIKVLIEELSDEDTLAVFRPESSQIRVWSADVAAQWHNQSLDDFFNEVDNVPVVPVEADDPLMVEAVEQAKQRLPEFLDAHRDRTERETDFVAKVRLSCGDNVEHIWINLIGAEPRFLHGTLANDPVNLGDLKIDDQVEVPIEDVSDWGYIKEGESVGFFTVAAMAKILKQRD